MRGPYLPGQWVPYWIKRSHPNRQAAGRWHGPARVLSTEDQPIVWLRHGTNTIRAPPEYIRPASLREWNQISPQEAAFKGSFRGSGGVSQVIDLEEYRQEPNNVPSPNEVITTHEPSGPSGILRPNTVLEPFHTNVNGPPETAESEEGLPQPEQELTPQVSAQAGATGPPATDGAAPLSDVDPAASVPLPDDSVDGLVSVGEPILLAEVQNEDESSAERFELIPSQSDHGQSILLAEDDLPWHETPLQHEAHQAYCIDIPLTPKDCKRWLQDPKPESLAHIAAAGKKARVEVRVKALSPEQLRLFDAAKGKELTCWVQTNAIRRILRAKLNPEQILDLKTS